jgi:tRNA nucleotidyltransferase (CCA-adding enzyme)
MTTKEKAVKLIATLQQAGYEAYIVGGAVRDLLRNVEPKDYDIVTSAKPNEIKECFPNLYSIGVGEQFGIVIVHDETNIDFEIATFRQDIYCDGRHPTEVKYVSTIEEDLARRDFTINAIAYDPIADITIDPFYGIKDVAKNQIIFVGEPHERIKEDR